MIVNKPFISVQAIYDDIRTLDRAWNHIEEWFKFHESEYDSPEYVEKFEYAKCNHNERKHLIHIING